MKEKEVAGLVGRRTMRRTRVVGIVVGGFSPGSFSTGDAARRGARDVTWTLSLSGGGSGDGGGGGVSMLPVLEVAARW